MTLPYERTNAIESARFFLLALLDPKETPRVPRDIRKWAHRVLKHFPSRFDMECAAHDFEKVFDVKRTKDKE